MTVSQERPLFPYGAVYFRKSNPPKQDWARDYAQAKADGMNTFRHWFMWSAIETAPGVYDWADYDCQLDLAAENGIQTIIAEKMDFAPEWAYRELAGCELQDKDGRKAVSTVQASSSVGGFPGLCLDHPRALEAARRFLVTLVERYKHHPGLGGYDIWNECNIPAAYCYCPATAERFRTWLKGRYPSLRDLGASWNRYSLVDWADVRPPLNRTGSSESLDWLQFRIEHAYEQMRWRAGIIRALDPVHPVTAHGIAASLTQMADCAADDWRAAAEVDSYGFTWVASRKGNEPWKQWSAVDLVRSASRGKDLWHAEMQGGPLWLQPQVVGRPRSDGRIADPEDVRLWNMVSFAGGARGALFPRWRPLLDGPLFGAFGPYSMAGLPTPRSKMASAISLWANAVRQAPLWSARPVPGELGIVVVPETQLMFFVQHGGTDSYSSDIWGVYRGFFDLSIQADYVHIDDIDNRRVLYLPVPFMLSAGTARKLAEWVRAGGTLISEGCPGYFGDHGRGCVTQPGSGLDEVFGVLEAEVEFTPDLLALGNDRFVITEAPGPGAARASALCGVYRQSYEVTGGIALGWYEDGGVALVEHAFGSGRTLLLGTCAGSGYSLSNGAEGREWFQFLLDWASVEPHARPSEPGVTARLHTGEDGVFLWVTNPGAQSRDVSLELGATWGPFDTAEVLWGAGGMTVEQRTITLHVGGRDAIVARLG